MSRQRPTRVAVLADVPLVDAGLRAMLAPYDGELQVVSVGSVEEALAVDGVIALLDTLAAPFELAVEANRAVRRGTLRLVGYSWELDDREVRSWLAAGARGYLWKGLSSTELRAALAQVVTGRSVVSDVPADASAARAEAPSGTVAELTPREAEVVALIGSGLSNEEIAEACYLSVNSVKSYIRTAYRKMGVGTRSQAVGWVFQHGFDCQRPPVRTERGRGTRQLAER